MKMAALVLGAVILYVKTDWRIQKPENMGMMDKGRIGQNFNSSRAE